MLEPHFNFIPPNMLARVANRIYGWLTAIAMTPSDSYQLAVKGRKSGKTRCTPVNLLRLDQKLFLVGTRGHTQWSRNAVVTGEVALIRGPRRKKYRLRTLTDGEKPEVLQHYLRRYHWMSGRFFTVSKDAPLTAFVEIAAKHPVFELFQLDASD